MENMGQYKCVIKNAKGEDETSCKVSIKPVSSLFTFCRDVFRYFCLVAWKREATFEMPPQAFFNLFPVRCMLAFLGA